MFVQSTKPQINKNDVAEYKKAQLRDNVISTYKKTD